MYSGGYGIASWQRLPTHVSGLRHYADHDVSVAFQINTNGDFIEDLTGLVPALEAAITDLALEKAD